MRDEQRLPGPGRLYAGYVQRRDVSHEYRVRGEHAVLRRERVWDVQQRLAMHDSAERLL